MDVEAIKNSVNCKGTRHEDDPVGLYSKLGALFCLFSFAVTIAAAITNAQRGENSLFGLLLAVFVSDIAYFYYARPRDQMELDTDWVTHRELALTAPSHEKEFL